MGCTKKGEELRNWENLQVLTIFQLLTLPSHIHSTSLDELLDPFQAARVKSLADIPRMFLVGPQTQLQARGEGGGMAPELIHLLRIYVLAEMHLISSYMQT